MGCIIADFLFLFLWIYLGTFLAGMVPTRLDISATNTSLPSINIVLTSLNLDLNVRFSIESRLALESVDREEVFEAMEEIESIEVVECVEGDLVRAVLIRFSDRMFVDFSGDLLIGLEAFSGEFW